MAAPSSSNSSAKMADGDVELYRDQEAWEEAMELFKEKEYGDAASSFSELLQQRSEELGERAYECADVAYYYGVSLFEHGKGISSNELLGAVAKQAIRRKAEQEAEAEAQGDSNGRPENDDDDEEEEEEDSDTEGNEEEEESPEECFETAHAVLELARQIYVEKLKRCPSLEDARHVQRKLVKVHIALAELAAENDAFGEAVIEYERALNLQQELDDDPRRAADIHMQIALSLTMDDKAHRARFHYKRAAEWLKKLEKSLNEQRSDVSGIVKDLEERVEELEKERQERDKVQQMLKNEGGSSTEQEEHAGEKKEDAVVHVLQVKRKRQDNDETAEQDQEASNANKRART